MKALKGLSRDIRLRKLLMTRTANPNLVRMNLLTKLLKKKWKVS